MVTQGTTTTPLVVRVEPVDDAYEAVLEDGEELVLAHYVALDSEASHPAQHTSRRLSRAEPSPPERVVARRHPRAGSRPPCGPARRTGR